MSHRRGEPPILRGLTFVVLAIAAVAVVALAVGAALATRVVP